MMKIFVFAYNRYDTMTTSLMLSNENIEHYVLCHSKEDAEKFKDNGVIGKTATLIPTLNPKGLTLQRNFALDMLENGEWSLFLNDDCVRITRYKYYFSKMNEIPNIYDNIGKDFLQPISFEEFIRNCKSLIGISGNTKIHLIGFASNGNSMFRMKRRSFQSLIDGRCIIVKKGDIRFDTNVNVLEDHYWTAKNLERYGMVLRDNWILPDFSRNTKGGFGSIDERTPLLQKEAKYIKDMFPYLFDFHDKTGYPANSQLKFKKFL